jgi:ribose transport system substrate-binding protein
MNIKRLLVVVLLVGMLLVPISSFAGGNKVVFVIMGLNNPYVSAQAGYTDEWAKKLGWDYTLFDGELDAVKNAKYLEDAIQMKPDMIILMPIDSVAVSSGIRKAHAAGIPVLMEHMQAVPEDEKFTIGYTGPGNYVQGQLVAEMFHEKLNGKGNIVEVTCVPGQETTIGRHNGFVDRLKELNSGVKLIASNNGDAQVDKTLAVMEDFLTRFGADGIDGIYCCDDTMAVAAAIALKEAGLPKGSIPIIGVGGSKGGLAAIKNGAMYGTIVQSPQITQTQTAKIVQKILDEGLKPPYQFDPYYMYVDHPKATKANVDKYLPGDW